MLKFNCTLCGAILFPDETIRHYDRLHGDIYVSCPFCRSQCEKYIEDESSETKEKENEEDYGGEQ